MFTDGHCYANYLNISDMLSWKPQTGAGERDMILMNHDIGVQWIDGSTEKRQVSLVVYGEENGYSAMAKTVGLPTGIATKMVLEGKIKIGFYVYLKKEISFQIYNLFSHQFLNFVIPGNVYCFQ